MKNDWNFILRVTCLPAGRARYALLYAAAGLYLFIFAFSPAVAASNPPTAVFDRLTNDISTDSMPKLTGIATDEFYNIASIECRVDGGTWAPAQPISGSFSGRTERFSWYPPRPLPRSVSPHRVEARCYNSAGNFNSIFPSYNFYVIGSQPVVGLKSKGIILVNGDTIDKLPDFEIIIIGNNLPITARRSIKESSWSQEEITTLSLTADPNNPSILYASYQPTLGDGVYTIKIEALDSGGNSSVLEVTQLIVRNDPSLALQSPPLCFPNPFNPEGGSLLYISYILTKSADVTVGIYDLLGSQIFKQFYSTGNNGAKAGYNEIPWEGRDDAGKRIGNGTYAYLIFGEGKVLGKGKVTILKQ
jgi:hypothetical protein